MDGKRFQDWLASIDSLSETQRTEALAVLSGQADDVLSLAAVEAKVEGRPTLPALRHAGCDITRQGTGSSPLPMQGLRAHVQCRDRNAVVGASSQGTVVDVRRVAG